MNITTGVQVLLIKNRILYQNLCLFRSPRHCIVGHRPFCMTHCQRSVSSTIFRYAGGEYFKRMYKRVKFHFFDSYVHKALGYYLYEKAADSVPHILFFKEMSLPDTLNSWFLVTELHVWMLMVRASELDKIGKNISYYIVEAMWSDLQQKSKKLGAENSARAQNSVYKISEQFQAALVGYDEGLLTNDKVLASALWRRFFEMNCGDVEQLETMVKYVRKQIHYLDNMSEDDFMANKIDWFPLDRHK